MPITKATASSIAPAAKGDLVVGSATNDASVLAVGSANQVLTVDSSTSTGLKWATPASPSFVGAQATMNGQTISYTQNVASIMNFDTESFDTNGFHSTVSNTSRLTIPSGYGGKYLFTLTGITMGTVPSYVFLRIKKNGTTLSASIGNIVGAVTGNSNAEALGAVVTTAVAGDYFEAEIQSDQTTGNKTIYGSFTCTFLGA